ncbi:MAG TPA: M56 family metallopeptidase [Longimicrobium sp.]|uniref:M56 family metallopeptidase n=1 Tax=Longimicrobium sp. TaxID=2029185 RepID=UPI002EDAB5CF
MTWKTRACSLLRDACARLGFRRTVRLTVSESLGTPVALGRAEICLPRRALEECSEEEMRAVLSHEVAHLVRHDPAWLLVSVTVESIFFFQPLNRAARTHLQEQAEYLSDQLAVERAGSLRLALARALAAVGGWLSAEREPLLAPALGEHRGSIARRVRCLLSDGWPASRLPRVARWSFGLAALALVMTVAPGFTAGGPWAWGTPAFQWSGVAAPGTVVEVGGLLGAIRAEPAAGDSVVVRATRHGRATEPDVRFEVVRSPDRVTICALYPAPAGSSPNRCIPGRPSAQRNTRVNDVEIDFVVQVPAGVAFHGYTSTGTIRTGLLRGPVHAESSAGDVDVRTTSHASAATGSGNVRLRMGSTTWADTLFVSTLSGNIRVWLPTNPQVSLAARSETGRVSSDFPLRGHRLGRWERMRRRGSLGEHGSGGDPGSGRSLVVGSRVGNISIERAP